MPDYSTPRKFAAKRRAQEVLEGMLSCLAKEMSATDALSRKEAAMDVTGMEITGGFTRYRTRTGSKRKAYLKVSAVIPGRLIPSAVVLDMGLSNDKRSAQSG